MNYLSANKHTRRILIQLNVTAKYTLKEKVCKIEYLWHLAVVMKLINRRYLLSVLYHRPGKRLPLLIDDLEEHFGKIFRGMNTNPFCNNLLYLFIAMN